MFSLVLNLTLVSVTLLKADLQASLPEVKSSHRVEALARGLGFRTYATLQRHCESHSSFAASFDGQEFISYLYSKGFEVSSSHFYRAGARLAIGEAIEKLPRLTDIGIGIGPLKREDAYRHKEIFVAAQEGLFSFKCLNAFLRSLALLARIEPIKSINPDSSSYRLKHIAENYRCRFPTGEALGPSYVPNGAFIAAAIHSGFKWRTYYGSTNAAFNMSNRVLNDLDCEVRPDGSRAQDRRRKDFAREQARKFGLPIRSIYSGYG